MVLDDPRGLTLYDGREEDTPEEVTLLCLAVDKYEAAMALYHCECHGGVCQCTLVGSATWLLPTAPQGLSVLHAAVDHAPLPSVRALLEHRGELQPFDEYKCAEKIDRVRLQRLIIDLQTDKPRRDSLMRDLDGRLKRQGRGMQPQQAEALQADLKKLQRCQQLEGVAEALQEQVKGLVADDKGRVVFQVQYEHRDPSGRGRLFAIGTKVHHKDAQFPRTTALQGMHADLRHPLAGEFTHDIDCENSEVRLVCSLASQLELQLLVPTLIEYRDSRQSWLKDIGILHGVSESESKRLPNIILSGGQYETWLRAVKQPKPGREGSKGSLQAKVNGFVFRLYAEIRALRTQLLQHPRFKWTSVDRAKLVADGKKGGAVESCLMPRIVQCCENEVLSIIHRTLFGMGWKVRAKVFDGLIAERGPECESDMRTAIAEAEKACLANGWDIRLAEKPLHGKHDEPLRTVVEARAVLAAW